MLFTSETIGHLGADSSILNESGDPRGDLAVLGLMIMLVVTSAIVALA